MGIDWDEKFEAAMAAEGIFPPDDSDAHPPLEPVTPEDVHYVVCAECGDTLGLCECGLSVTDHPHDGALCQECKDQHEAFNQSEYPPMKSIITMHWSWGDA